MIDINKYKYPLMESQCDGEYIMKNMYPHWVSHIINIKML